MISDPCRILTEMLGLPMKLPKITKAGWIAGIASILLFVFASYINNLPSKASSEFKNKAVITSTELQSLDFKPVIDHTVLYQQNRKSQKVACVSGAYTLGGQTRNGSICEKNDVNYVGLQNLSDGTLDELNQKMLSHGWKFVPEGATDTFDAEKEFVLHGTGREYGFNYSKANELHASLYFAPNNPHWQNCRNDPLCEVASSRKAEGFKYIVAVTVQYKTNPQ